MSLLRSVLEHTLLRFPGGDAHDPVACTYCPEMCRFACPTAVASGNDAVTPCNKMSLLYKERKWPGTVPSPLWPLYDCTGCGRCTEYCVYGVPVADTLFKARAGHGWDAARAVAQALTDAEDPCGDMAAELGDEASAARRAAAASGVASGVAEPRSLFFLRERGVQARLARELPLDGPDFESCVARLAGKRWLVHESVWLSRRLERAADVSAFVSKLESAGAQLTVPFEHGRDCVDCGGEGAYARLFPESARRMVLDIWERDRHRADAVLCFSARCAAHFRAVFQAEKIAVEVLHV